jgi:Spy/CpxP family protein refolding chaperone
MRKFSMMLAAAALAVAFAGSAEAQGRRGGGANQPGTGRGMGGGFGFGSVYNMLSTNKDLQAELKITDEQKTKLEAVAKDLAEKRQAAGGGGRYNPNATDEERKAAEEARAKAAAETKKAYEAVLTPDQAKRTAQINIQNMSVRAFGDKDVQTSLKMGDDQKEKIKTVLDGYQKDLRELMTAGGGGRGAGRGQPQSEEDKKKAEENAKKREALTKEAEEKIVATLSDDQKKSWTDLIGAKFDVSKLRVAPPRPRDN